MIAEETADPFSFFILYETISASAGSSELQFIMSGPTSIKWPFTSRLIMSGRCNSSVTTYDRDGQWSIELAEQIDLVAR
jgi:hypothetical protein